VRVLLDAHLSGKRLGPLLTRRGHDVLALSERPELAPLPDDEVLAFGTADNRIVVTRNSRDFVPILREWAEGSRAHAGCVLIWSLQSREHAAIARALDRAFADRPRQAAWRGLTIAI